MPVIRILSTGGDVPNRPRRRLWAEIGQPMIIGPKLTLTIITQVQDGERGLISIIRGPGVHHELPLPAAHWLDLTGYAGLFAIPRAAELSPAGRFRRVFIEFVAVRDGVKFHHH